uniref:P4 n=1 Tax=Little cherry virus 1 TaxID=217686 RepID=A0A6H1NPL5_9CLOS|nr:hypothetical protein [Little cherry virus 1]
MFVLVWVCAFSFLCYFIPPSNVGLEKFSRFG